MFSLQHSSHAGQPRALLNIAPPVHSPVEVPLNQHLVLHQQKPACRLPNGVKNVTRLPVLHKDGVRPGGRGGVCHSAVSGKWR